MKTLFRSLAIVAGLTVVALAIPAKAHANGFYGYYSSECCSYAPMRGYSYYPRYYNYYRSRHSVVIVIVVKHHRRHDHPYYMAGPYMGGYSYRHGGY